MKTKKIEVPITEEELSELRDGKVFNWTFDGIEIKLYHEEEDF